jgi:PAS domain-containing protein
VLPDPVAILDRDGTICYIDPAGVRLLDRPAGELTGRSIWGATLARCVAGDGTEVR